MGKIAGFLEHERELPPRRPVAERVQDFDEVEGDIAPEALRAQSARCMSCGVPFCHTGCPLGNVIPEWNDHVYRDRIEDAAFALLATNNFPEITGRVCPAPCEEACVLNISERPVTIKRIEREIGDSLLRDGSFVARPSARASGKSVAIVGSGPAAMACAQQLARVGHAVTVFERDDRLGGLLRYGIPDFKLDKRRVDARIDQMRAEGVDFRLNVDVGRDVAYAELRARHDALVIATGATRARDLPIGGRGLDGVHFAMDYLTAQNRLRYGSAARPVIDARDARVVILGGGDTGSDCLGTALRQGAKSVTQVELMPRPPEARDDEMPWPSWPMISRTSSSQEEGGAREWAVLTRRFEGRDGRLARLIAVEVDVVDGSPAERAGSERVIEADLCLLALGFLGPETEGLECALTERGTIAADAHTFATDLDGVFACGDARRGQSLVVWAIWEGRETARSVDRFLMGHTRLPTSPEHAVF